MSGAFGDAAVGSSRKGEVLLAVSEKRSVHGPAVTRDQQVLRGDSARKLNLARGDFQVNSHDPAKSAVVYRGDSQKAPAFLLERFREMMASRPQETLARQVPFLAQSGDREMLRRLQSQADTLRAQSADSAEVDAVERQRQTLRQSLTEKEAQTRRLRLLLQKAQEEARKRTTTVFPDAAQIPPAPSPAEPPPEKPGGTPPPDASPEPSPLEMLAAELLAQALEKSQAAGTETPSPSPESDDG